MYMPSKIHLSSASKRALSKSGAEQRVTSDRKRWASLQGWHLQSTFQECCLLRSMLLKLSAKAPTLGSKTVQHKGIPKFQRNSAASSQVTLQSWGLVGDESVCVHVCVERCTHTCQPWVSFLGSHHFVLWKLSCWALGFPVTLGWLVSKPERATWLCLPWAGLTAFYRDAEAQTQVPTLVCQAL